MINKLVRGYRLGNRVSPLGDRTIVFLQLLTGEVSCGNEWHIFCLILFIVCTGFSPNKNKIDIGTELAWLFSISTVCYISQWDFVNFVTLLIHVLSEIATNNSKFALALFTKDANNIICMYHVMLDQEFIVYLHQRSDKGIENNVPTHPIHTTWTRFKEFCKNHSWFAPEI